MSLGGDVARWLARSAPNGSVDALFPAFCAEAVKLGAPIWRASLALELLHPEVGGWHYIWTDEGLSLNEPERSTAATGPSYVHSPARIVDETGKPLRRRIGKASVDLPLLEELRLEGATDYVMYPLPFLDHTRTAVISFATRNPQGFSAAQLDALDLASQLLSPYLERLVLRRIAVDLLDTYVGPRTGQRILEGRVDRGVADIIEAAIWFTDLRGFTALSERYPIPKVLTSLDGWFGIIGEVVDVHGGEILKFTGDAVLAIFPTTPDRARAPACRKAFAAALEFIRRTEMANAFPATSDMQRLEQALALHVGEVAYGNVGARLRLDFTVIGPAVNRASRLLDLAKQLNQAILISSDFASEIDKPLADLGLHQLRDVKAMQRVFTLPGHQ